MPPFAVQAVLVLSTVVCHAEISVQDYINSEGDAQDETNHRPSNISNAPSRSGCPFKSFDIGSLFSSKSLNTETNSHRNFKNSAIEEDNRELLNLKIFSPYEDRDEGCQNKSMEVPNCKPSSLYRELDGSCTNLGHPTWGQVGECQLRLMPAEHRGDAGFPRSATGKPLPQPRELSLNIFQDFDVPAQKPSRMFTLYAEFQVVDVIDTVKDDDGGPCCPYPKNKHRPECKPIAVGEYDPFYSRFNVTCMNFHRSKICAKCDSGKIQQPNLASASLDLSNVYGTSSRAADGQRLRDGTGQLRLEDTAYGPLIPSVNESCRPMTNATSQVCLDTLFNAGDARVNMHSSIMSLQTVFMREHNAVAKALKEINPHWKEEKLYQEARKITGAKHLNSVYKEYLPLLLGPTFMSHFHLWVKEDGSGTRYNESTRLGIWIETSTASMRTHSMLTSPLRNGGVLRLLDTYFNPRLLRIGMLEELLAGASEVPAHVYSRWHVVDVTNYLRQNAGTHGLYGDDLTALTIQRSRDHGLPFYVDVVKYITEDLVDIKSFDDLSILMLQENIDLLKQNYESVSDVELWVGMNLEKIYPGSQLGFLSGVLLGKQYYNLKYGDRFYYEHEEEAPSFTAAQRETLKKSSLSRILCGNSRIVRIQRNALLLPDDENPVVSCDSISDVDLNLWKSYPKTD